MTTSFEDTLSEIERGVVGLPSRRDLVEVSGPDARSFLQGQLSQDLSQLAPGETTESLVLNPRGKLDAYVRVHAATDERFLLDVAADCGEALAARLSRFKLRVRANISVERCEALLLRGPAAAEVAASAPQALALAYNWPPFVGVDLVHSGGGTEAGPNDVATGEPAAFEYSRIRAGEPVMGAELTEDTIAQETPLTARTVSFTKGCFTGQELVARLDARGSNVARHLRGLVIWPGTRHRFAYVGEPVTIDGKIAGTLSSVVWSPVEDRSYALAYLARRVVPPTEAVVVAGNGEDELSALVLELPMLEVPMD